MFRTLKIAEAQYCLKLHTRDLILFAFRGFVSLWATYVKVKRYKLIKLN